MWQITNKKLFLPSANFKFGSAGSYGVIVCN